MQAGRALKLVLPFVVSAVILTVLLARLDLRPVLQHLELHRARVLVMTLAIFGLVSVWLEAHSLRLLIPGDRRDELDLTTAMRIKAASYLLNALNIALGAGALAYLLRKRSHLGVQDAAGIVLLIAAMDLGLLLLAGLVGASMMATERLAIRGAVLGGGCAILAGGLLVLRSRASLGALEPLRQLELFRAARATPVLRLAGLAGLRALLVAGFMSVFWVALISFDVRVPMGSLLVGIIAVVLVSSLPIAVSGLGTGQAAFIYVFASGADEATLLACSLSLSLGLILLRGLMGLSFSAEFTRDALSAAMQGDP